MAHIKISAAENWEVEAQATQFPRQNEKVGKYVCPGLSSLHFWDSSSNPLHCSLTPEILMLSLVNMQGNLVTLQ